MSTTSVMVTFTFPEHLQQRILYWKEVWILVSEPDTCEHCQQSTPGTHLVVVKGTIKNWIVTPTKVIAQVMYGDFDLAQVEPEDVYTTQAEAEAARKTMQESAAWKASVSFTSFE
jgi:hypothetical protein